MVKLQRLPPDYVPSQLRIDVTLDVILTCSEDLRSCTIHNTEGELVWKVPEYIAQVPHVLCVYDKPSEINGARYIVIYDLATRSLNVINIENYELENKFQIQTEDYVVGIAVNTVRDWLYVLTRKNMSFENDSSASKVHIYTTTGDFVRSFGRAGSNKGEFCEPVAICTNHRHGYVAVLNKKNGTIQVFDHNGEAVRAFGGIGTKIGMLDAPTDMCFDSCGNLIVSDAGNHRIQCFNNSLFGKVDWMIGKPELLHPPRLISVDSDGDILVCCDTNGAEKSLFDWYTCPLVDTTSIPSSGHPGYWDESSGAETGEFSANNESKTDIEQAFFHFPTGDENVPMALSGASETKAHDQVASFEESKKLLVSATQTSTQRKTKEAKTRKDLRKVDVKKLQSEFQMLRNEEGKLKRQLDELQHKLTKRGENTNIMNSEHSQGEFDPLNLFLRSENQSGESQANIAKIVSELDIDKLEEILLEYKILAKESIQQPKSFYGDTKALRAKMEENDSELKHLVRILEMLPARDKLTIQDAQKRKENTDTALSLVLADLNEIRSEASSAEEDLERQVNELQEKYLAKSEELESLKDELEEITKFKLSREIRITQLIRQKGSLEEQLSGFGVDEPYLKAVFESHCEEGKDYIRVSNAFTVMKKVFEHRRSGEEFDLTPAQVMAYFSIREDDPLLVHEPKFKTNSSVSFNELLVAYASLSM